MIQGYSVENYAVLYWLDICEAPGALLPKVRSAPAFFMARAGGGAAHSVNSGHSRMLDIAEFFAIEKDIRGHRAEERRLIRQQRGRPLADAFLE